MAVYTRVRGARQVVPLTCLGTCVHAFLTHLLYIKYAVCVGGRHMPSLIVGDCCVRRCLPAPLCSHSTHNIIAGAVPYVCGVIISLCLRTYSGCIAGLWTWRGSRRKWHAPLVVSLLRMVTRAAWRVLAWPVAAGGRGGAIVSLSAGT